ncbi:unnamed protein product [Caenorhabditis brenneri]
MLASEIMSELRNDCEHISVRRNSPCREVMFQRILSSGRTQRMQVILLPVDPKHQANDNKPEIDYVEMGLTEFVKNPFETDSHNDPEPNDYSDVASDESTEEPNTSSSPVGRTDPEAVVIEDINNTSQIAADSGSFKTELQ